MGKYLVTGGEGFIGSRIVRNTGGEAFDLKSGKNILDETLLSQAVSGVSGMFHCAAKISVPESIQFPEMYFETNVLGTKSVIKAAEKAGIKIVFSSSAAVYGESKIRVQEDAQLFPQSPYAENKRDGEELLRKSSIPHIALRYFNVYGPGQSPQYAGVISAFIKNALKGEDLMIFGDGKQVRDFIFVDDVVSANIAVMNYKNTFFEIFNIGTGTETNLNDLAQMIIKLTKSSSKIIYKAAREGDIVYSQADVSKAERILGWKAKVSLEEGLKKTIESFR